MKSRLNLIFFQFLLIIVFLPVVLSAQMSKGGLPCSFTKSIPPDTTSFITVQPPSMDVVLREDQESPLPYRFAINLPVDLGIGSTGQWINQAGNTKIWRLNIKSPGAHALILYFDRYNIPAGGKVFVYNPKRNQLLGAFTSFNNNDLSTFATGLIYGDELTLEYDATDDLQLPELHISEVGHAYRGVSQYSAMTDFGEAGKCQVNVNCGEGSQWQEQKRSVARITVKRGGSSLWCTGSLINNTRNDGKPYILTADHCGYKSSVLDISQWIFYFNYEGAGCPNPAVEPPLKSITGATLIAHGGDAGSTGSDFFLVLLKSAIPASYNAYLNGWSREANTPSPSGTGIHHPWGDIKKISTYSTALQLANWSGNPNQAHWRVTWSGTINGHGTTEPGSSGSPLFDNLGRLVGHLTGGDSSCDTASLNLPDYYGMFSYDWDKNGTDSISQLKYWLDPDNTGVMTMNGWAFSVQESEKTEWMKVFPNPVMNRLNVAISSMNGKALHITLHDIWGNLRLNRDQAAGANKDIQLDLSEFAAGMYILGISDGDRQMVRKIVKL